jgi:hypothetical protein
MHCKSSNQFPHLQVSCQKSPQGLARQPSADLCASAEQLLAHPSRKKTPAAAPRGKWNKFFCRVCHFVQICLVLTGIALVKIQWVSRHPLVVSARTLEASTQHFLEMAYTKTGPHNRQGGFPTTTNTNHRGLAPHAYTTLVCTCKVEKHRAGIPGSLPSSQSQLQEGYRANCKWCPKSSKRPANSMCVGRRRYGQTVLVHDLLDDLSCWIGSPKEAAPARPVGGRHVQAAQATARRCDGVYILSHD